MGLFDASFVPSLPNLGPLKILIPSEFNTKENDYFTPFLKLGAYAAIGALLYFVMDYINQAEDTTDAEELDEIIRFTQRLFTYGVGALVIYLGVFAVIFDPLETKENKNISKGLSGLGFILAMAYTAAVASALAGDNEFNEEYHTELTAGLAIPIISAIVYGLYYLYSRQPSITLLSSGGNNIFNKLGTLASENKIQAGFMALGTLTLVSALATGLAFMLLPGVQDNPQNALSDLSLLNECMGYAIIGMGLLYGMHRYLEACKPAAVDGSTAGAEPTKDEYASSRGLLSAMLLITGVILTVVFAEQSIPEASCTSVLAGVSFLKAGENMAKNHQAARLTSTVAS